MAKNTSGIKGLLRHKKVVTSVGLIVVVAVGSALSARWYYEAHRPQLTDSSKKITTKEAANAALAKPQLNYDRQGASQVYGAAAANAKDSKQKADLQVRQGLVEEQQGHYQAAIDLYEQALSEGSDQSLTFTLAQDYEHVGNKPKAVENYQKARDYYQAKPANFSGRAFYISVCEQKIKELQS